MEGAILGVLVGGGAGALIGYEVGWVQPATTIFGGFIGVLVGGLVGILIASSSGKDKAIQIEGMTGPEIQKALDKLRKKARIRDYK